MTRVFLTLLFFLSPLTSAYADVPIFYHDSARTLRERELLEFLKTDKRYDETRPFTLAAFDLNGDGVEEWIFRQNDADGTCDSKADCPFVIAGLSEGKIILLGEAAGRKIGIADEKQYGVRKLLVYNEKNDDYASKTYVWTPADQAFRPE